MTENLGQMDTAPSPAGPDPLSEDPLKAAVQARLFPGRATAPHVGRFSILDVLGEGGMGTVLTAYDDQLDRRVALKLIKGRGGEAARARMLREAQAMARLNHPNVVPIFDVGEHEGQLFVAMEYVRGQTLRAWQDDEHTLPEVVSMYLQAARGLAAAHAKGLVHRDFKPHNAMVDDGGRVRVLDFGLASRRDEAVVSMSESTVLPSPAHAVLDAPLTRTGAVMGTPAYMSPEQFMAGDVDGRSDQFSFCVALWEALHGNRPFAGRDATALFTAIAQNDIATPQREGVPPALVEVLLRGLQAKPEDRWPDLEALIAALAPFATPTEHTVSTLRRLAYGAAAIVVYGALLYGLNVVWTGRLFPDVEGPAKDWFIATMSLYSVLNSPIHVVVWHVAVRLDRKSGESSGEGWGRAFAGSWVTWVWLAFVLLCTAGMAHAAEIGIRSGWLWAVAPVVAVPLTSIWIAPRLVAVRGRILWSALLGLAACFAAGMLGEEAAGRGLRIVFIHIGAVVAMVASGLSVGHNGRSFRARLAVPILLVSIIVPLGLVLGLRGLDGVPSARPVLSLEPAVAGAKPPRADNCTCPGCLSGGLGRSLADVDVFRLEVTSPGFSELKLALEATDDSVEVGTYTQIFDARAPSIVSQGPLELAVRKPARSRSFSASSYCLAASLQPLPAARDLVVPATGSPLLAEVEWARSGEGWQAQASGATDATALVLKLPSPLLIDTQGPLPFESIDVANEDVRLEAARSLVGTPDFAGAISVPVKDRRWEVTLRLESPEEPDPGAHDRFASVISIESPLPQERESD